MRYRYLKPALVLTLLLGSYMSPTAQIVLHDATNVTQTKATLSADFPDTSVEHGFQYKYGTLPVIDDFSHCALAPNSDPVNINPGDLYSYAWTFNSNKREVISNGNLPIGADSKMSVSVDFHSDSEISFEWAVDSEEGIGILSFSIDDKVIDNISGYHDYTKYYAKVSSGTHILTWSYCKKDISNYGLDIGKVKSIYIDNTIGGDWSYINGNDSVLTNLRPNTNILYCAIADSSPRSELKQFKTLPIMFSDIKVSDKTQTDAVANFSAIYGDAIGTMCIELIDSAEIKNYDIAKSLLSNETFGSELEFIYDDEYVHAGSNILSIRQGSAFIIKFVTNQDSKISFDVSVAYTNQMPRFYIDNKLISITCTSDDFTHYSFDIGPGEHELYFRIGGGTYYKNYIYLKDFCISNVCRPVRTFPTELINNVSINLYGLKPRHTYIINPRFDAESSEWSSIGNSTIFTTMPIDFHINENYNITQTTAKINFEVQGGNSVIKKVNFEYHPAGSERWSSSDITGTDGHYSKSLNRLKPGTPYEFRICAVTERDDSVYSPVKTFSTLPVEILPLELISATQTTATIKIPYHIGDAQILRCYYKYGIYSSTIEYEKDLAIDSNTDFTCVLLENLPYDASCYIEATIEPVGSETIKSIFYFRTQPVVPLPPTIKKVSMHEAVITGRTKTCDAKIIKNIRVRRTTDKKVIAIKGINTEDSIFNIRFKDLERNTLYEAATDVDNIISDWIQFKTEDDYFKGKLNSESTETTITFHATVADLDSDVVASEYGFEYTIINDGFGFIENSEIISVPTKIDGYNLTTTVSGLAPGYGINWRAYVIINNQKSYYTGTSSEWIYNNTDYAYLNIKQLEVSQTSIKLSVEPAKNGDAIIDTLEYRFYGNKIFNPFEKELIISNLIPGKDYSITFRGTVNGRVCSFYINNQKYQSYYQFKTKPLSIYAKFSGITQTKATMTVTKDFGDAEVTELQYRLDYGEYRDLTDKVTFTGLTPGSKHIVTFRGKVNGVEITWTTQPGTTNPYTFTTASVSVSAYVANVEQTTAMLRASYSVCDATFITCGFEYGLTNSFGLIALPKEKEIRITELIPATTYYYRSFVETKEGGEVYSVIKSFTTSSIICTTAPADQISNRSARLNGTIDCDSYSSAEFGFQWKSMTGWLSDPAFTKGVKKDDGEISVALTNGMLEPNTDYEYRTAVRYKGKIYATSGWKNFRTESEYVLYPGTVYTMYRTDRENNLMVFCGYYVAGSEEVVARGYDYWKGTGSHVRGDGAPAANMTRVECGEDMTYTLDQAGMSDGTYYVRAFIRTASGETYGTTLPFTVTGGAFAAVDDICVGEGAFPDCKVTDTGVLLTNVEGMSVYVYDLTGKVIVTRHNLPAVEDIALLNDRGYVVCLSNGMSFKVRP